MIHTDDMHTNAFAEGKLEQEVYVDWFAPINDSITKIADLAKRQVLRRVYLQVLKEIQDPVFGQIYYNSQDAIFKALLDRFVT